jgi:hypothetical protein
MTTLDIIQIVLICGFPFILAFLFVGLLETIEKAYNYVKR